MWNLPHGWSKTGKKGVQYSVPVPIYSHPGLLYNRRVTLPRTCKRFCIIQNNGNIKIELFQLTVIAQGLNYGKLLFWKIKNKKNFHKIFFKKLNISRKTKNILITQKKKMAKVKDYFMLIEIINTNKIRWE